MVDIHSEEYILGQNIRKYRLRLGWSQADLSNAVDIDRADISKYENGAKGIMSSTLLRKFAKVVQLYFYKGMTQQEIAEEIGIGRRSVGNCLEGALKKIRKNF